MQERDDAIDELNLKVELGERMQRLINNDDFRILFFEVFQEAYAVTTMKNYSTLDPKKVHDNMMARSKFDEFITNTINDGYIAKEQLAEAMQEDGTES